MNFCPSCAPCAKASRQAPSACPAPKARFCQLAACAGKQKLKQPRQQKAQGETGQSMKFLFRPEPFEVPRLKAPKPSSDMPAPISPAISAWLSLVGIPYRHAETAQSRIESCAAPSVTSACAPEPTSTRLAVVAATAEPEKKGPEQVEDNAQQHGCPQPKNTRWRPP